MEPVRIGMIGVNNFGKRRRETLNKSGLFKFVMVCDRDPEALAVAMQEEGCEGTANYQDLLDREDIEAIVISTGADSHAPLGIQAAKAGKHFFVEKPVCCNMDELRELITTGERAGIVMGMGHDGLGGRDAMINDMIAQDKFGASSAIDLTTCHSGGFCESAWRFIPEKNPGGMLFQCGVHSLHWLQSMFGPVEKVASFMNYDINPNTRTSDATQVIMRMESGLLVTLNAYHVTPHHHYKFIYGTLGNLYIYDFPTEIYFQERHPTPGNREGKVPIEVPSSYKGKPGRLSNVASWAHAIREGGMPTPSIYDGARAVAVVFAADESARTGQFVTVPDVTAFLQPQESLNTK